MTDAKNLSSTRRTEKLTKIDLTKLPPEQARAHFQALLLYNPNYFGNLKESKLKPVLPIINNTTYEELGCVGFQPALNRLEAVVYIKQSSGYGGDICSNGSQEYVRLYLSYDNGATWQDQGSVSFTVYDVPGEKPIEYSATLEISPPKYFCLTQNLPMVRAILSWNRDPDPNSPNWTPVWGNVVDAHIQIGSFLLLELGAALAEAKVKVTAELAAAVDLSQTVSAAKAKALSASELVQLYKGKDVPSHRFLYPELKKQMSLPVAARPATAQPTSLLPAQLEVNIAEAIAALLATDGDISYEELGCVGLDFSRDALVGILKVKRSYGYSGGPCTAGSQEYVAFWVDWGDGAGWTYVGTSSVNVHDFSSIPADGLEYAVVQPVDIASHMQPCTSGAKTVRVRAILSWQTSPPPGNPNWVPPWGNRKETLILVRPGFAVSVGTPNISIIGGIGIASIDTPASGLTLPNARFALTGTWADPYDPTRQCPFGGQIVIQGYPSVGYKYRVWARKVGGASLTMLTDQIWTVDLNGFGTWRTPDGSGFFTYLPTFLNIDNVLAYWYSTGDAWSEVMLEIANLADVVLGQSVWYRIQLDNTAPTADMHIDSGGDCKDFTKGTTISGHFVARDTYFGHFSLSTLPTSLSPNNPTTTTPTTSETAPSPGDAWSLNTTGMTPCGYVVQVEVWDRSIVGSSPGSHNYNRADVGFCLRATS